MACLNVANVGENMSNLLRRELPLGIGTFIVSFLLLDFYISIEPISVISTTILEWSTIIFTVVSGLGIISITRTTIRHVERRSPYWYLRVWTLFLMIIGTIFGYIGAVGTHPYYDWMMMNLYAAIRPTLFSMVAFGIISSLYRTFRLRNRESLILFIAAISMMIRNAPISSYILPWYLPISEWLFSINSSARSSIKIISGIGLIAFAIRLILQREKPVLGLGE